MTAITTLVAVLLLSWATPTYDVTATISEVEAMGPLSMMGKALSISEASAHRGSKAHNRKHRKHRRPPPPPITPPSTLSPTASGSWSDPAIWGNSPPQAGAAVTIPAGIEIVLDESPETL
ncbi:MAG TPA: hypothetical protein VFG99_12830, partial [Chloroflexia bacterium]|nr:hypothetical protein [Chloroflexia bacterium]